MEGSFHWFRARPWRDGDWRRVQLQEHPDEPVGGDGHAARHRGRRRRGLDPGGTATLSIPGGSLKADTDITLATSPRRATPRRASRLGSDGTQFSPAASLVIKVPSTVTVPTGMTPTLATYDGTKWAAIEGSTFANGQVTGPVAHFSKFTVIFVNGQVVVTNSCSDIVTQFVACGGDVTGTWNLTDFCEPSSVAGTYSTDGGCPGFALTADITPSGSITFAAAGTYTQTEIDLAVTETETVPTLLFRHVANATSCDPVQLGFKDYVRRPGRHVLDDGRELRVHAHDHEPQRREERHVDRQRHEPHDRQRDAVAVLREERDALRRVERRQALQRRLRRHEAVTLKRATARRRRSRAGGRARRHRAVRALDDRALG